LEHIIVWCWKLDTSESRSGLPGKFAAFMMWQIILMFIAFKNTGLNITQPFENVPNCKTDSYKLIFSVHDGTA
jgi:hypothetical protein